MKTMQEKQAKIWWKEQVIYQIYPRSFNDSNDDGIGDLPGIIEKLDYLKELGVDIIWLSPIYESPNDDNGYDISDYYKIHPEFGSMADFDTLLAGLHERGMKLIMDLVVNHTSDEHNWFEESRKSKDNPYRDYYFWKPGKDGGPPNNWKSFFGGSAWQYDALTDEYFLHLFTKKQPDLNWENPMVREDVYDVLKFWCDKGIDGFRMDVIPLISKRLDFSDTTLDSFNEVVAQVYSNGPKVHEYIHAMYERVLKHYDVMTVGEGPGITKDVGLKYVGHDRGELNMIFHLDHMFLGHGPRGKFDPVEYNWQDIKELFLEWDEAMGDSGWISIFLDNHDFPRLVSRFGNDKEYRVESAKLLAMLVLTLRGTACIYQGSEIGMTNVNFADISDYRDVETHNFHAEFTSEGMKSRDFLDLVAQHGRDNVRTPIQWNSDIHAGFTDGKPWIGVNPNFNEINVVADRKSDVSIYKWYQQLLAYRKLNKTLVYGKWTVIDQDSDDLYVYERSDEDEHYYIVLNHSNNKNSFNLALSNHKLELQNVTNTAVSELEPWEARLYKKK
ncbi:alpha-glucosidase [Saprospiraceae bacterium]|nr:alpha-glucosidase [Saprospiraceae bacterium]